ncbi:MAG: cytochrome P450 [Rhodospirillaceae bacterium]|nr:MAG: cytochrome P450 [Rhodospirillaceae bacterium]
MSDTAHQDQNGGIVPVPSHVDPKLVVDFDYEKPPGIEDGDTYKALKRLHAGPDIVWTPRHGGHWIVTRAEDIKWVQETYQLFSHKAFSSQGRSPFIPPISVDPPDSIRYRALFNPYFTKRRVEDVYQISTREIIVDLIEKLRPKGRCEFVREFAFIAPVSVFFNVVNLPLSRREEFLEWGRMNSWGENEGVRAKGRMAMIDYIKGLLKDREKNPGDDIFTSISGFRNNSRFQNEDEIIGMAYLVFVAGQDTVAAQMSFAAWQMAQRPELHHRLRDDPAILPQAVEEFLRRHGLSNTFRLIVDDCERKGVQFKKGDLVMVPIGLSGLDERSYDDPFRVDFDRPPAPHNTFGNGAHLCVAATLARMEIRVFLEEWSKRMPPVRFDPDKPAPVSHAGAINGLSHLHLAWDV